MASHMIDTQREYISDIFTSGQHLLSLINGILDLFSRPLSVLELEAFLCEQQALI
jgi:two-component system, cell cycle sensor histidine kinase PleC